jgi:hypothetical protein
MVGSSDALALARGLLTLAERNRCGVVHVRTERGAARLRIGGGAVLAATAIAGHDKSLGDALMRSGDLSAAAHFAALPNRIEDKRPVGEWLAEEQLATRGAVEHALRAQLRGRVLTIFSCRELNHEFVAEADGGVVPLAAPLRIADIVLSCLRARALSSTFGAAAGLDAHGHTELTLSSRGRHVLSQAVLWPEEAAVAGLLLRGGSRLDIDRLCVSHPRASALLRLLHALGGVVDAPQEMDASQRTPSKTSYGLLARKRSQVRHGDGPHRLLDLPLTAGPADARKALRQFAGKLHPDALGPDAPEDLRRASIVVMGALIDAERKLRESFKAYR